jgi:alkylation response protein AidB-like acyl-CoA dehydrogenase
VAELPREEQGAGAARWQAERTMDLAFTDEQAFLREAVRGTIERECPPARVRELVLDRAPDHAPFAAIAVRQGWTGIGIAEELGGQGGGVLELAILAEELGRGAVPCDGLYASLLACDALARTRDAAAPALIEQLASGATTAALALTGERPLDVVPAGGAVALVLGARDAATLLAWDGATLTALGAAECRVRERLLVDRTRSLADVVMPAAGGTPIAGAAPEILRMTAAVAAVLVAADALGAAQRMLELTVAYVGDRIQFGVPVGSFQAVKHAASEMLVAIEGTRGAVHYAAWALGDGEPGAITAALVAKSRAARAATLIADRALFLHGAVGYTWEHDLQLLFKRAKSDAVLFGGAPTYEDRIADALDLG